MKKILTILFAALMVLTLAGCAKKESEVIENPTEGNVEVVSAKGVYTVANNTGGSVGGVFIYPVGSSDKGENFVSKILADEHYTYLQNFKSITIDEKVSDLFKEWNGPEADKPHFVFEFYAYDGDAADQCGALIGKFDNLALEEATIVLITEDMRAGATQIAWGGKDYNEFEMTVNFYNHTGSTVTSLKATDSETGAEVADILKEAGVDKIENKNDDAPVVWKHKEDIATANTRHYNITWETEDGQTLSLMTEGYASHPLSFENTDMVLRNADVCTGATTVYWILAQAKD